MTTTSPPPTAATLTIVRADEIVGRPAWLRELRGSRARSVWENGLRPTFRDATGAFDDPDPHDLHAHHLVLTVGTEMVGGVRLAPLELLPDSRVKAWDPHLAGRLLATHGCAEQDVLEAARLWISPALRRAGLATRLIHATSALAYLLGRTMLWATSGTRQGQLDLLEAAGWQPSAAFGQRDEPELGDTLCVVTVNLSTHLVAADLVDLVRGWDRAVPRARAGDGSDRDLPRAAERIHQ
jgi:GNAT superfamily N-acetyltransferase